MPHPRQRLVYNAAFSRKMLRPRRDVTKLHLFWDNWDNFLHPYGVTTNGKDEEEHNGEQIELLNALLPRLQTKEEKSRILEGFHRARLDEQLRLSKLCKRGDGNNTARFLADDEEEVSRMTDLFQQARLSEQLRLSQQKISDAYPGEDQNEGVQHYVQSDKLDKSEALHRALLQERLKLRQLQTQGQMFVSSSEIEKAFSILTDDLAEEKSSLQTLTMVQEREGDDAENVDDTVDEIEDVNEAAVVITHSNGDNSGKAVSVLGSTVLALNQTEDDPQSKLLGDKLERLQKMVALSTSSAASATPPPDTTSNDSKSSIQSFLSSTHLPLPPREDASFLSLALAPLAHMFTSLFLMGAAGFYAVLAVFDVLWNDNKGEYSTRACLREASSVFSGCAAYVFPADAKYVQLSAFQRTWRALQTSCIAVFYAMKAILLRASKHSRYADESLDAGTGALRYLVYAARSVNVLWNRLIGRIPAFKTKKERNNNLQSLISKVPHVIPEIRQRFGQQRSLQDERRRLISDEVYDEKLRRLNLDRVALERERHLLQEERLELEFERRKLLSEGVQNLVWYSAAMEAASAAEEVEEQQEDQKRQKKRRLFWRGNGET